jgi:hypothetical protein
MGTTQQPLGGVQGLAEGQLQFGSALQHDHTLPLHSRERAVRAKKNRYVVLFFSKTVIKRIIIE